MDKKAFEYLKLSVASYRTAAGIQGNPFACPCIILHRDGSGHFEHLDENGKTVVGPSFSGIDSLREIVDYFQLTRENNV
jgi:hypothetical protein